MKGVKHQFAPHGYFDHLALADILVIRIITWVFGISLRKDKVSIEKSKWQAVIG